MNPLEVIKTQMDVITKGLKVPVTFEGFLEEKFMEDEPQTLDDDMTASYERWLGNLDTQEIIDYAEELVAKLQK